MKEKKSSRFIIEVLNSRSLNNAVFFIMSMLCVANRFVSESEWGFMISILSIAIVFLFSVGWILYKMIKHQNLTQMSGRWDQFFSIAQFSMFIAFSGGKLINSVVLLDILSYIGAAMLLVQFLYFAYRR